MESSSILSVFSSMPLAPMRLCPEPGCPTLTRGGPCATHARQREQRRGTAHQRGYNGHWLAFKPAYLATMVRAGVIPVCGASLPTRPPTQHSLCRDAGLLTFTSLDGSALHLDHDPPLEPHERHNPRAVCDPNRIVLLCARCHNAKTAQEQRA